MMIIEEKIGCFIEYGGVVDEKEIVTTGKRMDKASEAGTDLYAEAYGEKGFPFESVLRSENTVGAAKDFGYSLFQSFLSYI